MLKVIKISAKVTNEKVKTFNQKTVKCSEKDSVSLFHQSGHHSWCESCYYSKVMRCEVPRPQILFLNCLLIAASFLVFQLHNLPFFLVICRFKKSSSSFRFSPRYWQFLALISTASNTICSSWRRYLPIKKLNPFVLERTEWVQNWVPVKWMHFYMCLDLN